MLYVTVMICAYVSVWVPLWGCLCRQLMELTAVFRIVVASSLGILGPLISSGLQEESVNTTKYFLLADLH